MQIFVRGTDGVSVARDVVANATVGSLELEGHATCAGKGVGF